MTTQQRRVLGKGRRFSSVIAADIDDVPVLATGGTTPRPLSDWCADIVAGGGGTPSDVSTSNVTATGTTTPRTLADRAADIVNVKDHGAVSGGDASSLLTAFQAAIDALPSAGGHILVPPGTYSNLNPGSLSLGSKVITWNAFGAILPANMPGMTIRAVMQALPETSFQSDRTVKVQNYVDFGNIDVTVSYRQYGYHVRGFLNHVAGAPSALEARAFSFDLGTDQDDVVDAIRGMKGRVYATAGKANIRSIYGYAESTDGGTHTGELTGLHGAISRNGNANTNGDSFAVRGHADDGCSGLFQAAASIPGATVQFGYSCRTGTGGQLLATVACFQAHGGGAGDMFMGYASNTDLTKIFQVTKFAHVKAASYYSGTLSIADDAVATITPPAAVGFCKVWNDGSSSGYGEVYFRTSTAACGKNYGAANFIATTGDLTGTTGTDGNVTVSMGTTGLLNIENRTGATKNFNYFFVAK